MASSKVDLHLFSCYTYWINLQMVTTHFGPGATTRHFGIRHRCHNAWQKWNCGRHSLGDGRQAAPYWSTQSQTQLLARLVAAAWHLSEREPGSSRYSFTPSLTAVWSNYQTLYNDFFEVYITKYGDFITKCSNGPLTNLILWMQIMWIVILRSHC